MALAMSVSAMASDRPGLIITADGVEKIRAGLGTVPLFDATVRSVQTEVDAEIAAGIDTPVPRDFSGGYTHERHKQNFFILQKAGALYLILDDEKYAAYVRDMLFQYEAMYKDLPLHPQTRSYARGKLFWQCLNDANWLLYVSQAYDAIYDFLSEEERTRLEDNLFRPFADHISVDSPQFFNRVHNHSTWGNAAVGMIGLAMRDDELLQRALYGLVDDGLEIGTKDDDGGFIKVEGQKVGFLANLEEPFSPDGYYTEGPYYQRYAMSPFLVFAQALQNVRPDLDVFSHKDGVLLKAVDAILNLADADGEFFPLNDAQKGMSYHSRELVAAVDIAYLFGGQNPQLLAVAGEQGQVTLDDAGFAVAAGIRDGKTMPFRKGSVNLSDGPDGNQGGVAVLRSGDEDLTLVFKYAAQGLSHGHYDKLSVSLYERGEEILQDYGLARFVNIEQKGGGNYLPENSSWAKQTIAHSTITQDETSHFNGDYATGSQHHSALHFFDATNDHIQVVSAVETNAYPGTVLHRTLAVINEDGFEKPFLLDVFRVRSEVTHQYDLPFYYFGQVIDTNFNFALPPTQRPLGDDNGYQHLFLTAAGDAAEAGPSQLTWLDNRKFYTLTVATRPRDTLLFTRIGAKDRAFNLRSEPGFMVRRSEASDTIFASIVEPHGSYDPVPEQALNARSSITNLAVVHDDAQYTAVRFESRTGNTHTFIVSNAEAVDDVRHTLDIGDARYEWSGPYHYE